MLIIDNMVSVWKTLISLNMDMSEKHQHTYTEYFPTIYAMA